MTYLTQGIILRRSHYGEYDRQYAIYTADKGKVIAVAKGTKKICSKLNAHLDFFSVAELMLAPGSSGVERIAGAKFRDVYRGITHDLARAAAGYYFLEAADRLTIARAPDPIIFDLIRDFFGAISFQKDQTVLVLNKYIFELLKHLGYQPRITANSQKQLLADLNRLIESVCEKKMRCYELAGKVVC